MFLHCLLNLCGLFRKEQDLCSVLSSKNILCNIVIYFIKVLNKNILQFHVAHPKCLNFGAVQELWGVLKTEQACVNMYLFERCLLSNSCVLYYEICVQCFVTLWQVFFPILSKIFVSHLGKIEGDRLSAALEMTFWHF